MVPHDKNWATASAHAAPLPLSCLADSITCPGNGRHARRAATQFPLHQHGVHPLAELEADGPQCSDALESETLMHCNRRLISAVAYHGQHLPPWPLLAPADQFRKQRPPDPMTVKAMFHI